MQDYQKRKSRRKLAFTVLQVLKVAETVAYGKTKRCLAMWERQGKLLAILVGYESRNTLNTDHWPAFPHIWSTLSSV